MKSVLPEKLQSLGAMRLAIAPFPGSSGRLLRSAARTANLRID
jgi:hypothetical protein